MKQYLFAGVLALGLTACTSTERAEVKSEAEQTRARAANAREEYSRKMQDRLDRIDREIDEERAKAEGRKMNAKARREYNEKMADLQKMRAETKEKWGEFKNSTENGWEKFKDGVDNATDKLDRAWENFKADLKS